MTDDEMQRKMDFILEMQAQLAANEEKDRERLARVEEAFRTLAELERTSQKRLEAMELRTSEWAERTEAMDLRTSEWAERTEAMELRAREWAERTDEFAKRTREWAEFTEGRMDRFDEKLAQLIEAQTSTQATLRELAAAQTHTDDRLNILIDVVERYISKRSNGNAQS